MLLAADLPLWAKLICLGQDGLVNRRPNNSHNPISLLESGTSQATTLIRSRLKERKINLLVGKRQKHVERKEIAE